MYLHLFIIKFTIRNSLETGKSKDLQAESTQTRNPGELMVQFPSESEGLGTRKAVGAFPVSRLRTQEELMFQFKSKGGKKLMS
jgi:hypothetical protein